MMVSHPPISSGSEDFRPFSRRPPPDRQSRHPSGHLREFYRPVVRNLAECSNRHCGGRTNASQRRL